MSQNLQANVFRVFDAAEAPDPDLVYRNYVETCRRLGIEPVPRECAVDLIQGWTETLTATADRSDPATH